MTRDLGVTAVVSDALREAALAEGADGLDGLVRREGQRIRGIDGEMTLWTL